MAQIRSYRRRGSPDLPLAIYLDTVRSVGAHPIPEYHPEIEIVRMLQGHTIIQLDGIAHSFGPGDIFIIPGNTVHYYQSFSPDAQWHSTVFSLESITMHPEHYFQTSFVQPLSDGRLKFPQLLQPNHPAYEAVASQLKFLLNTRIYEKNYKLYRFAALISICTTLAPYCTVEDKRRLSLDTGNEAVRQCMCYIHNNHAQKLTLEDLAKACHLHPNYVSTLFKQYTGKPLFEYITHFRVETAAQLLKKYNLPVGKVGEMVGFRSESLFFRQFKAIMGITPKAYAKAHREK